MRERRGDKILNNKLIKMLKKRDIELLYQVVEKLVENNHTPIEMDRYYVRK